MNKHERERLKKAFDIPEPQNKKDFIAAHSEKFFKNRRSRNYLPIFRYAPAAIFAVMLIGLWGIIQPKNSFREKIGKDNIIIESDDSSQNESKLTSPPKIDSNTVILTTSTASKNSKTAVTTVAASNGTGTKTTAHSKITGIPRTTNAPVVEPNSGDEVKTVIPVTTTEQRKTSSASETTKTTIKTTATASKTSRSSTITTTGMTTMKPNDDHPIDDVVIPNNDYTITPSPIYGKTDNIYILDNIHPSVDNIDTGFPGSSNFETTEEIKSKSAYIVSGKVTDIFYTKAQNMPYTQIDISITESYGVLSKYSVGDSISIYIPGGYMPSDEYFEIYPKRKPYDGDFTVFDDAGNPEFPEKGENYIFFLKDSGDGIPDGAVIPVTCDTRSVFKKECSSSETNIYTSLGNNLLEFTGNFLNS